MERYLRDYQSRGKRFSVMGLNGGIRAVTSPRTKAVEDFEHIRKRIEELRLERERAERARAEQDTQSQK